LNRRLSSSQKEPHDRPQQDRRERTDKILSVRTLVVIKRDVTEVTPRAVWAHEIPILEAIHGEGNVVVQDPTVADEGYAVKPAPDLAIFNKTQDKIRKPSETLSLGFVFFGDHRAEFDRLCNLYDRHPDENKPFAEYVYGRFAMAATSTACWAAPTIDDLPDEQLRTLVRDYGFIPNIPDKATDAEVQDARAKQKQLLSPSATSC
jgi:hypothetical protein